MLPHPTLHIIRCLSILCALVPSAAAVQARQQQVPPPTQSPSPLEVWREDTLLKALASVRWDDARQGPLLIVNPAHVRPRSLEVSAISPPPPLGDAPPEGWTLRRVGEHFSRREFAVGTLTVLAPAEMVTLNSRPGRPNPLINLSPADASSLFLASLTSSQMKIVMGAQGIGTGDLDQRQRGLFLAMLPEKSRLTKSEVKPYEEGGGINLLERRLGETTLTETMRRQARFKLQKKLQLYLNVFGQKGSLNSVDIKKPGDIFYRVNASPPPEADQVARSRKAHGVEIRRFSSNKLKPGQIAFDAPALNPTVTFDGAATIGDLVQRISQVCRVELHVDRRVGRLPVWTRGGAARSGDVLQALCLAVSGAFRKVGPAYLLTQDVEGMAVQRTRLQMWAQDAVASLINAQRQKLQTLEKPEVYDKISSVAGELFPVAEAVRKAGTRSNGLSMPVSDLPARVQESVRTIAARYSDEQQGRTSLDQNAVSAREIISSVFVLPGVGEVEASGLINDLHSPPKPPVDASLPEATPPVMLKTERAARRALCVSARVLGSDDATTVRQIVDAAARRNLNQIWVSLTPDDDAAAILGRFITAGRDAHITVWSVPSLLRPARAASDEERDRDLMGGTAGQREAVTGWRRVDTPEAAAQVSGWLGRIAEVPGLGGIAVRDWAAPGYLLPPRSSNSSIRFMRSSRNEMERFGYTPEMRLAFIRKEKIDPIDLIDNNGNGLEGVYTYIPFFPYWDYADKIVPVPVSKFPNYFVADGELFIKPNFTSMREQDKLDAAENAGSLYRQWDVLREAASAQFLSQVQISLKKKQPTLPLFVQMQSSESAYFNRWFGNWDSPLVPQLPDIIGVPANFDAMPQPVAPLITAHPLPKIVTDALLIESDAASAASRGPYGGLRQTSKGRRLRWNSYRDYLNRAFGTGRPRGAVMEPDAAKGPVWDGFVLDLTSFVANEIPAALGELLAEKGAGE